MGFLFGNQQQQRPAPVTRMPSTGDAEVRAAAQRERRSVLGRSGRSSTVLTRPADGTSTQSYTNSLLGSAG